VALNYHDTGRGRRERQEHAGQGEQASARTLFAQFLVVVAARCRVGSRPHAHVAGLDGEVVGPGFSPDRESLRGGMPQSTRSHSISIIDAKHASPPL